MEKPLSILLVEDDANTCQEIIRYIDDLDDAVLVDVTNNSMKAERIIRDSLPDAVILDLELHYGGGSGISLLQALQQDTPPRMPYILVTTNNSSAITYEAARQSGADYIFSKHQADYSSKAAVDFLRALKNIIQSNAALNASSKAAEESSLQKSKRLSRRICAELDRVGISPKATGYSYLVDAIQMITVAPTQNLCSIIGQKYGKTESSVERAMQNAIAKAWRTTPIDDLLKYYTAKIRSDKGVPTITEFIYYYANKLKNEY
ncbi:MAG: response regulator [Clostridiales bacterium]|nr:response regulator [Candidatus Cacconaster stercorequi]